MELTAGKGPGTVKTPTNGDGFPTMEEVERKHIELAVHVYKGNLTTAAIALKIGRATLYRKIKQYGINVGRDQASD